jgi:hypothetical protein
MRRTAALLPVLALVGCDGGAATPGPTDDVAGEVGAPHARPRVTPATTSGTERRLLILVNTADALYRVDPVTFDVTLVGTFTFPDGEQDLITDIARDSRGRMWGVGFAAVYSIDPTTLACTRLARHYGHTLNALSIVTAQMKRAREVPDIMIAAQSRDSTVSQVDPTTGELTPIGNAGGGLSSSGDITWASGVGAVMLASDFAGYEGLVVLEPDTFAAKKIGPGWSFQKVRGLSLLPGGLLAVTEQGELLEIDPRTGAATLRRTHPLVFYGGAVGWDDAPVSGP